MAAATVAVNSDFDLRLLVNLLPLLLLNFNTERNKSTGGARGGCCACGPRVRTTTTSESELESDVVVGCCSFLSLRYFLFSILSPTN